MLLYTADFETTTTAEDCRVWAWGVCEITENENFHCGNDISSFFTYLLQLKSSAKVYFHNLKFDGEFILYYLFRNGWEQVNCEPKHLEEKQFTCLISNMGAFYSISLNCGKMKNGRNLRIDFIDSLKILPFSVSAIAGGFGLKESKLVIDYNTPRPVGHILTPDEKEYLKNDVLIVAKALKTLFDEKLNKMTQGANALADFKRIVGKNYDRNFPQIEYDEFIRKAYKGGWCYLNPCHKGKTLGKMLGFDVVSLYPDRMYNSPLPYGHGVPQEGKYKQDKNYPLFVQKITCQFELKDGFLPTIQIKKNLRYQPTEYLTTSQDADGNNDPITLYLSTPDVMLFFKHYNIYNEVFEGGYKFRATTSLFTAYIDKWFKVKNEAGKVGNKAMRQLAKLMLNALYGKTASAPTGKSQYPVYDKDEDFIHYITGELEERKTVYIPAGVFITAWARHKTITAAQANYDRFVYSDTDSLYLLGDSLPTLDIGGDLGQWEHEKTILKGKFLRAKTYILETKKPDSKRYYQKDKNHFSQFQKSVTCAGLPERCHKNIEFNNFYMGAPPIAGKLMAKRVRGGVVLVDTPFSFT